MARDAMSEDKAVKARMEAVCQEIREFLAGSGELRGRVYRNVLQHVNNPQAREIMEKEGFFETEGGQAFLEYFEYMYRNFSKFSIKIQNF